MIIKPVRGTKVPSSNDHVLRMALRVLTMPWAVVRGAYRGACRLMGWCRSDEQVRDADQRRQSRARRTLRGLTPDHDAAGNVPRANAAGEAPPVR
jgi:hypothetical protein